MKTVYKNGPLSNLMRASFTENCELRTDNFINSGHSIFCVIIVQPLTKVSSKLVLLQLCILFLFLTNDSEFIERWSLKFFIFPKGEYLLLFSISTFFPMI